jgi:hypothetical protein
MSSSSSLSAPHDVVPTRSRRLSPTRILWADPSPCDCYDQAPGRYTCIDQTGRKRAKHEYLLETRKGTRCVWCSRLCRCEAL